MRRGVVVGLVGVVVGACRNDSPPKPAPSVIADAVVVAVDADADACKTALAAAPKVPGPRRAKSVIDGCAPCGDWAPILAWNKPRKDGGPTRELLEASLNACKAFCDANAKQRFLNTVDDARAKDTRGPWRYLGEMCKASVSAVPDARYSSASFFALDRIARDAAGKPELAPLLDAIEIPLPAVSVTGAGLALPDASVVAPDVGTIALTLSDTELRVAAMPRGKLGKDGVSVVGNGEPYPGALVKTAKELDAAIGKLGGTDPLTLFAPPAMPALRLVDALKITGKHPVRLAVKASGAPGDWEQPGTIPVALSTGVYKPTAPRPGPGPFVVILGVAPDHEIERATQTLRVARTDQGIVLLEPAAKVADLAKLLGGIAYFGVARMVITPRP